MAPIFLSTSINNSVLHGVGAFFWCMFSVFCARWSAYRVDTQYRDIVANPRFVEIKRKWYWLFKFQKNTYVKKILRTSFVMHCVGYSFSFLQLTLLGYMMFIAKVNGQQTYKISICFTIIIMLIELLILLPWGIKHNRCVRKFYEYDLVTYFKEILCLRPRRKCIVEQYLADNVYLVRIGHIKRSYFRALSEVPVALGSRMYAVHVNDEKNVNWILKEDKFLKK